MRVKFSRSVFAILVLVVSIGGEAYAQNAGSPRFEDNVMGVSFAPIGRVTKPDDATCAMTILPVSPSSSAGTIAEVSVSSRPFVDLPGSYGGRLYLDPAPASGIQRANVRVDSILVSGLMFRREYWAVYAGMGMWEGVVNCYARAGGRYCVVSLVQEMRAGKPGEEVLGKRLNAESIRAALLSSLRDSTAEPVNRFNQLLSSVQFTGK